MGSFIRQLRTMLTIRWLLLGGGAALCLATPGCHTPSDRAPAESAQTGRRQPALRMIRASEGGLAPVYAPLAEDIAARFDLADKTGVGIDVGSGPGTLIVELCKRSDLHWINADINPHFFAHFYELAGANGLAHRVSAVAADVHDLPFRSEYADVIVSRGSYRFWKDKPKAFREIYRVLKPGGGAYIGRGFSANLPLDVAKQIRAGQGKNMMYDLDDKAQELKDVMAEAGIRTYQIHRPMQQHHDVVNYGIWIEIHKPESD